MAYLCPVSNDELENDTRQTKLDDAGELTLADAKANGDFDQAVKKILTHRITLEYINEQIDFYTSGSRSELIEREQLGQAVVARDWSTVNLIMRDIFEAFIAWETLHIQIDLENEPGLIEEALNHG